KDFVTRPTRNHEEGNTVADLRNPSRLLVKARFDCRFRRIVPDQAVTVIGDNERNAGTRPRSSRVVVPALDRVASMVEITFLILTQAVIVLIIGRTESGANLEKWLV